MPIVFTGDNLLGTEARLRRIKSANNRFITTSRRTRRDDNDDSSSSTTSVERSQRYRPLLNDPEERPTNHIETEGQKTSVETIKPEVKQNGSIPTKPPDKIQKRRPKTAKNSKFHSKLIGSLKLGYKYGHINNCKYATINNNLLDILVEEESCLESRFKLKNP
ncbi:Uncharacterized protein DBV15_10039 [Temnothorax longispinosus]|uniref:Uncharacterized protein n=1 Tax=Temnothorax longispinosus TaxID=300112 RepID=A0A4S2JQ66_9HYME|nr:Uncharacterized protein DBV15_10039 [Temnothorax longispinosus]